MASLKSNNDGVGVHVNGAYVVPAREGELLVWKAFKYRLYPTDEQRQYFAKLFGCCRFVYNHYLEVRIKAWEAKQADPDVRIPTRFDMCRDITRLKRETVGADGEQFLREVDATALTYQVAHLEAAFDGFFRRVAKRKAKGYSGKLGFPRFKGKHSKKRATVSFPNPDYIGSDRVRFAKIGWVRANVHRPIEGEPVCATISEDPDGRWWVSIKCKDASERAIVASGAAVGLSLGNDPLVVASNGERFGLPEGELAKQLVRGRRRLSKCKGPERKRKPSARYEKQRLKVAKLYATEADRRQAALNKLTHALVEQYGTIVVRDVGNHEFLRQLRYKCEWAGRAYVELPALPATQRGSAATATIEGRVEQAQTDLLEGLALLASPPTEQDERQHK